MKNTSSGSEEGFFKKKGFFIALYSTLGAVMVLALVITFTNLTATPGNDELAAVPPTAEQGDTQSVDASDVESYEVTRAEQEASDQTAWWRSAPKPTPQTTPSAPSPAPSAAPAPSATPAPAPPALPVSPPTSETPAVPAPAAPTTEGETTEEDETEASSDTETSAETAFTPFSETDKMIWPVDGEIAMDFSVDKLVYDPTLDQYRTNDDLRITAKEGTPVKACADGQVLEVGNNHVYGNYVSIDHGNGYVTTYGQLMEGVLVDAGEVVEAGRVIGGVGKPSYFGSLNGTHMNLRLTQADEAVDPKTFLANAE